MRDHRNPLRPPTRKSVTAWLSGACIFAYWDANPNRKGRAAFARSQLQRSKVNDEKQELFADIVYRSFPSAATVRSGVCATVDLLVPNTYRAARSIEQFRRTMQSW